MNKQKRIFSRRQMLAMAIGAGGIGFSGTSGAVFAQEAKRLFTPGLTVGPFYPQLKPLDMDADLTLLSENKQPSQGKIIHLTGRILNLKGEPVSGIKVEIWQANSHGKYAHPSDPNTAPDDENFQGFGVQTTDAEGRYRFKTIKPGAYPGGPISGMRTPHIHFDVMGKYDRLVTQVFFPGEPLNKQDKILQSLKSPYQETVIMKLLPPTKELEADSMLAVWDVVLRKG